VGVFMGKRDFVDRVDSVDPVGVVLIDPEALAGRKFVTLSCIFRYGRDDMDVIGIAFRRELYLSTRQVYPPLQDREKGVHTKTQAKLLRKLGNNAYPFFFEFPDNLPCSVALQPGPHDVGKLQQCAVEFEIKAFSAESQDAKVRKRSTVKLMIRKVQYAPDTQGAPPSVETTKDFLMSDKPLHVKVTLDKELYYHGETIHAHVNITNNSNKNIKNVVLSDQVATVVLYSNDSYIKCVDIEDSRDSVSAGATLQKVYKLLPLLANNRERRGIALDGKLKHEDTNLASSSVKEGVLKEVLGIMVSYKVMVKLIIGEVGLEVPFTLMHPKPEAKEEMEDEMVFQEFKRSYLKGIIGAGDDDDEEG
uniref:S-arrestin n=1 Tax=Poecilia mexicana TaxID=48701 RepID=A0A3B3YQC2_9TELE